MIIHQFDVAEGFEWVLPEGSADFEAFRSLGADPVAAAWKPVEVRILHEDMGTSRFAESDFPFLGSHVMVMRERAVAELRDLLERHGEILPLKCKEATLFAFHVLAVVDALDWARSRVVRLPSGGVLTIEQHAFQADRLEGVEVFKIPQMLRGPIFVSEAFVERINRSSLRGFHARPVWSSQERAGLGSPPT